MTWIYEEPFWLILALTLLSISSVILACGGASRWFFVLGGSFLALAAAAFFVEQAVETDREKITSDVYKLANAVESNDVEAALAHFLPSAQLTLSRVRLEMPKYDFRTCNVTSVSDVAFDNVDAPTKGDVEVRVYVNVDASKSEFRIKNAMAPRTIVLSYRKTSEGVWKISDYHHYDPRQGDFMKARNPTRVMPGL